MKRKTILAMCVLSMTVFWGSYVPVMAEDNKAKAEAESTVETADEKKIRKKEKMFSKTAYIPLILTLTAPCFM